MDEKKEIASDAGHWYRADGSPAYTTIGKNGKERATTLRDARVEGLLPSVTTILQLYPKPFLQTWLQKQVLMSALTLTRQADEPDDAYIERIMLDSQAQSKKARELGQDIHGAIERWLLGQVVEPDMMPHVSGAIAVLSGHLGQGCTESAEPEKSFASVEYGYGGKVDLHSRTLGFVVDFKSKSFAESDILTAYPEQAAQLSAYAHGLGLPGARLINVYISTTVPGLSRVIEHPDNGQGWLEFRACLSLWQTIKKYAPEVVIAA